MGLSQEGFITRGRVRRHNQEDNCIKKGGLVTERVYNQGEGELGHITRKTMKGRLVTGRVYNWGAYNQKDNSIKRGGLVTRSYITRG